MSASSPAHDRQYLPRVAIVGNDAVLAAAPATPVQLAHACLRHGFVVAVPASWGDELVAGAALEQLAHRETGPTVLCTCPFARARLLGPGPDLAPFLVSLVAPPIAAARYLRSVYGAQDVHITYIGGCPSAEDPIIDVRLTPDAFFAELAERDIALTDQPLVFESVVPPDRRRWHSLPGGAPSPELLWNEGHTRTLVEIERDDVTTDLAQHIIGHDNVLLDLAPSLGCVCSGAVGSLPARSARIAVAALEPPRARGPVIDPLAPVTLDAPVTKPSDRRPDPAGGGAMEPLDVDGPPDPARSVLVVETSATVTERVLATADEEEDTGDVLRSASVEDVLSPAAGWNAEPAATDPGEPVIGPSTPDAVEPQGTMVADRGTSSSTPEADGAELAVETARFRDETQVTTDAADEGPSVRHRTPAAPLTRYPSASIPRRADAEGRMVPRAYAAKRRTPAGGMTALTSDPAPPNDEAAPHPTGHDSPQHAVGAAPLPSEAATPPVGAPSPPPSHAVVSVADQATETPSASGAEGTEPIPVSEPMHPHTEVTAPPPSEPSTSAVRRPLGRGPVTSAADPNQGALMVLLVVALLALGIFVLRELR